MTRLPSAAMSPVSRAVRPTTTDTALTAPIRRPYGRKAACQTGRESPQAVPQYSRTRPEIAEPVCRPGIFDGSARLWIATDAHPLACPETAERPFVTSHARGSRSVPTSHRSLGPPRVRHSLRRVLLLIPCFTDTVTDAIGPAAVRRPGGVGGDSGRRRRAGESRLRARRREHRGGHDGDMDEYRFGIAHVHVGWVGLELGIAGAGPAVLVHVRDRWNVPVPLRDSSRHDRNGRGPLMPRAFTKTVLPARRCSVRRSRASARPGERPPQVGHSGNPTRRISAWKRGSARSGSNPGRISTPGLNRSS